MQLGASNEELMPKRMRGNKTQRVPRTREQLVVAHYERMSKLFMDEDIRGPMMAQAAKDMQEAIDYSKEKYGLPVQVKKAVGDETSSKRV